MERSASLVSADGDLSLIRSRLGGRFAVARVFARRPRCLAVCLFWQVGADVLPCTPKPSCSKTQEWKERSAEAEHLLFGEDSQTPNVSDSEEVQAPDTAECERKWGKKPKGFIGEIPIDSQGKRINQRLDFDLLDRARENNLNDSDLFHQPPSPSLDGSNWSARYPPGVVLDNFWLPDDAQRLPIDPKNPRLSTI